MTKHPPLSYLRPVEVESIERLRGARKVAPAGLPSMKDLLATHGHAWLCEPQNANVRFVSPFPCMKCGGFVHRVGNGTCVECVFDLIILPPTKRAKDKTDTVVEARATRQRHEA